ncbi:class I SAM-dependent methyltransferase [Peptoniphilus equinus]|uniref:Class I SAM-dependent methyltransferase n=1 Tax=Peptoniphilus equinus TaxID=3016343 RepID=A0ABY7QWY4_9FIRM|nr:class I SAM-dependent methyltransferase [Peptoniphilus equinus]WBW50605.1 class I SAM-dependent methyltransferase [Peptoniphilus equinus]
MKVATNYLDVTSDVINAANLKGTICVDATCGRGGDSLRILKQGAAFLYGCDVQEAAICDTKGRLEEAGFSNFKLFQLSHENVFEFIGQPVDFVIYNLGYLPGSDKTIITKGDSTVASLASALKFLRPQGMILVVSYVGHPGSFEERAQLEYYLKHLDQKHYAVEAIEFFNERHNPPKVFKIGVRS